MQNVTASLNKHSQLTGMYNGLFAGITAHTKAVGGPGHYIWCSCIHFQLKYENVYFSCHKFTSKY